MILLQGSTSLQITRTEGTCFGTATLVCTLGEVYSTRCALKPVAVFTKDFHEQKLI